MKVFEKHLKEKGLVVVEDRATMETAHIPGELLDLIRTRRWVLVPVLASAAIHLQRHRDVEGSRFCCTAKDRDAETVRKLFDRLRAAGLIRRYEASPRESETMFIVALSPDVAAQRFFRFSWAEACFRRMAEMTVRHYLHQIGPTLHFDMLSNVKIARKGEEMRPLTELDFILEIGDRFYVIEVKSGPWIRILQWAQREQLFAGSRSRVIVCTSYPGIPPEIFRPQILFTLDTFESGLLHLLEQDFGYKLQKTQEIEKLWWQHEHPEQECAQAEEPGCVVDACPLSLVLDEDVFHVRRTEFNSGCHTVQSCDGDWVDDYDQNAYLD